MRRATWAWILVLTGGAGASAQEMDFSPAPGLKKFETLLGTWEGSGKVFPPEGDAIAWTSKSKVRRILNGHAYQEDMVIEFGGPMPALRFRSFTGWDRAADAPVGYSIGNNGGGARHDVRWVDEKTLVTTTQYVMEGVPVIERSILRFGEKGYHLRMEESRGGHPVQLHVEGEVRRAEGDWEPGAASAAGVFSYDGTPPPGVAELQPLAGIVGSYRLKGQVLMAPDAPMIDILGNEEIELIFGGSILAYHGTGDPVGDFAWEGFGYQWWSPERDCFEMLHLDNMGGIGMTEAHLVEPRRLVVTGARHSMGQPTVERTVVELDDEGRIAKVRAHSISGTHDPALSFAGEYTYRPEGAKSAEAAPAALQFRSGSCCDRAQKAGKDCTHPCCVTAAKKSEVCVACN